MNTEGDASTEQGWLDALGEQLREGELDPLWDGGAPRTRSLLEQPSAELRSALLDVMDREAVSEERQAEVIPFERAPASTEPEPSAEASAGNGARRRTWVGALFGLAAALALSFGLRALGAEDAELPVYDLLTDPGAATTRASEAPLAEPPPVLRYDPSNAFTWQLRPERPYAGELKLAVCAAMDGRGPWRRVELPEGRVEVSESGAVLVAGPVAELGLAPGDWQLRLLVSPDAEPGCAALGRDGVRAHGLNLRIGPGERQGSGV